MRKLLLLTMLAALPLSCGTSQAPVSPRPISLCAIPELPAPPQLAARECGPDVCITPAESVALAGWIRRTGETRAALEACSLVHLVPE